MRRGSRLLVPGNGIKGERAVLPPGHHGLVQKPQQIPGERGIVALTGHGLDQSDLVGDALLALGQVPVGQVEVFMFLLEVGHCGAPRLLQAGAHVSFSHQRLQVRMCW